MTKNKYKKCRGCENEGMETDIYIPPMCRACREISVERDAYWKERIEKEVISCRGSSLYVGIGEWINENDYKRAMEAIIKLKNNLLSGGDKRLPENGMTVQELDRQSEKGITHKPVIPRQSRKGEKCCENCAMAFKALPHIGVNGLGCSADRRQCGKDKTLWLEGFPRYEKKEVKT